MLVKFCKLFLCVLWATPALASGNGGSVDNGGQYCSIKFTRMGYEIFSALKKASSEQQALTPGELGRFEETLNSTRVDAVAGPILDNLGREVDARYVQIDGKPVIELDRDRWLSFLEDFSISYRLVLHEYLRALGIDDSNYRVSVKLDSGLVREILNAKIPAEPGKYGELRFLDEQGILRKDSGEMVRLSPVEAFFACPMGFHLPTIREVAEEAVTRGAKILEGWEVKTPDSPSGFSRISGFNRNFEGNPSNGFIPFYFNNNNAEPPKGDLGKWYFWTSTATDDRYFTLGFLGSQFTHASGFKAFTRCVKNRAR